MKRLILFSFVIALIIPVKAQDIKVKSIKKIPVEGEVSDYSFGEKSNKILISGKEGQAISQYNTRFRSLKPMPEADTEKVQSLQKVRARAAGRKIEVSGPDFDTRTLAPVGEYYYVWITLSPDEQHLLFKAVGKGCFVADLEGNIINELGNLNAPSWMNNQWILGMKDKDDGHQFSSSEIIAVHASSGKTNRLSSKTDEIALYPKASPAGDRIVFRNEKGELFTMKIRIKK